MAKTLKKKKFILKSDLIEEVQNLYPHYTQLSKMKKSDLLFIHKKQCNDIPLIYSQNSCYMDSLFIALFSGDINEKIYNLIIPNKPYSKEIDKIKNQIRKNYDVIIGKTYKEITCTHLRRNLHKFYKIYAETHNNLEHINWKYDQVDPTQLLEFLLEIFNNSISIKENIKMYYGTSKKFTMQDLTPGATRTENSLNVIHDINVDVLMNKNRTKCKDKVLLRNIFPIRKEVVYLDDDNKLKVNGKMFSTKVTVVKILSAQFVYVNIDRVVLNQEDDESTKIDTLIIPFQKLKLVDNKLPLYLKSILIHHGSSNGGHFVCIFDCKGTWYLYDDLDNNIETIGSFGDVLDREDLLRNSKAFIYA